MAPQARLFAHWQRFDRARLEKIEGRLWLVGRGAISRYDPLAEHSYLRGKRVDGRHSALYLLFAAAETPEEMLGFADKYGLLGLPFYNVKHAEAFRSVVAHRSGSEKPLAEYWARWHPIGNGPPPTLWGDGLLKQQNFRYEPVALWETRRREMEWCLSNLDSLDRDRAKAANLHVNEMVVSINPIFTAEQRFGFSYRTLLEALYLMLAMDRSSPGTRLLTRCEMCGEIFWKLPREGFKFCSALCRYSSHNRKQARRRPARQKAKRWLDRGKPMEEIVPAVSEEFGLDAEEVSGWIDSWTRDQNRRVNGAIERRFQ